MALFFMQNKGVFFDRDGIINKDFGYVSSIEQVEFIDPIFDICAAYQKQDYLLFIVTNQSGIGRGYYTENKFIELMTWMLNEFRKQGIEFSDYLWAPYFKDSDCDKYRKNSYFRKPSPGMISKLITEYDINPAASVMIGDQHSDMLAARLGRIEERILVSKDVCPSFDNFAHNYKTLNDFYKDKFLMADEDALG